MLKDQNSDDDKIGNFKIALLTILGILMTATIVFLPAGRISYWQGWVFCGIILLITVIQLVLFLDEVDLIKERMKPGPGVKWWDKIFLVFFKLLFLAIIIVACLDAGRFGWSNKLHPIVYIISYPIFLLSIFILLWAMKTNRFFSSMVRIQTDRGHTVITGGPYRFVRHPGYTGGILMLITTPLILGSFWGLIPSGIAAALLLTRTFFEDKILKNELSGYAEYAKDIKYRLFPGIW